MQAHNEADLTDDWPSSERWPAPVVLYTVDSLFTRRQ